MAKKKEEPKIVLERTYNIPLRKEWLKVAKYRRAKKAVRAVREFLFKHMKAEDVKVGKYLNLELWKRGIKNPPHHIKVNATKDDKGLVKAELVGAPVEKVPEKKEKPKTAKEKVQDMIEKKKKTEEKKEETKEKKPETTEEKVKKMVEKTKKHEESKEPSAEDLLKNSDKEEKAVSKEE